MELEDLAYPLIAGVVATDDPAVGFKDVDYAIFLGAFPRKEGMERKDVMEKNVGIFNAQVRRLPGGRKSLLSPAGRSSSTLWSSLAIHIRFCLLIQSSLDQNCAPQGSALAAFAKPNVKCLVVGNPANTNAAILAAAAKAKVAETNISALTRLDHNRAQSLAASKMGPCRTP